MTLTATEPKTIQPGAHTTHRPWEGPHVVDRGIPWELRKYVFNWTIGRITVAPCGDGHASNGGWKMESRVNTTTGKETFVSAVADEEAYEAQNRLGFPIFGQKDAEKIFKVAERDTIPLRDALFEALDLDDLGLNEAQKLSCAGAREVYAIVRPEVKASSERVNAAKLKLAELTANKKRKK